MRRFALLTLALLALPVVAAVWEATRIGFQQWRLVADDGTHISWHQSESEAVEWGQKWSVANDMRSFQTMHMGTRWDATAAIVVVRRPAQNYGHYFATNYNDTAAEAAALCEETGVEGVNFRRTWGQVEPTDNGYDFSEIADDPLSAIAASTNPDCKLFLFVEYKSFSASPEANPCPPHLQASYSALNTTGDAYTCFMWESEVVAEFKAMLTALSNHEVGGVALRDHPNIEGYIFQESALGFGGAFSQDLGTGDGTYTADAFRDALIEMLQHSANTAFPAKSTVMFLNFIRNDMSHLYDVSTALALISDNRGCYSGPDLLPDNDTLYSSINHTYEVLTRHDGCRSNSAQNDSYQVAGPGGGVNDICDDPDPDCTMAEIFAFGVGGTFGDFDEADPFDSGTCINSYFFWNHREFASSTGLDWTDALPVIAGNPYGTGWTDQCVGGGGPL